MMDILKQLFKWILDMFSAKEAKAANDIYIDYKFNRIHYDKNVTLVLFDIYIGDYKDIEDEYKGIISVYCRSKIIFSGNIELNGRYELSEIQDIANYYLEQYKGSRVKIPEQATTTLSNKTVNILKFDIKNA